jgi:hypothetical protein
MITKKFAALAAMFLSLFVSAAAHGAPAPATTSTASAISAMESSLSTRMAKAEADIEKTLAAAKASPSGDNLKAYADCRKANQDDLAKIDKDLRGRLEAIKRGKADKKVVTQLLKDFAELKTLSKTDREGLIAVAGRLGEVESKVEAVEKRTTGLEARTTGIEVRQNFVDTKIENLNTRVSVLESSSWKHELRLGAETGRGIATSETGFVIGYATTSGSGVGYYTEVIVGAGDVLNQPHFTSAVIRAGVKSSIGSPDSPLSAHLGFLFGTAAKTSLALDAGFSGGASAGLTYKPKNWPVGFTANVGQVFGRFEGLVMSAGAFFDPLGLANLGK